MTDRLLIHGLTGAPAAILAIDGRIAALDDVGAIHPNVERLDGRGLSAHPGFIELQVNGIAELDFSADPASIGRAGAMLARHGVTGFLPTIVSAPRGTVEAALDAVRRAEPNADGAVPLGIHAEGPFISPARPGAHDPAFLRRPDLAELAAWIAGGVRMVTLAPELPRALEAIGLIVHAGAIAAIGHTDADATTTTRAIDAGARYATHLFNAMPPLHHRDPGPVGPLLADERVTVGLIGDGVHVAPSALAAAARAAAGRVSIVSDGVGRSLAGRRSGGGRLDDGRLAGGASGLDHCVRTMASLIGQDAAMAAVTSTPARLLGLDDGRGHLRVGGRADVVLLTDRLEVAATIVGGRIVHRAVPA